MGSRVYHVSCRARLTIRFDSERPESPAADPDVVPGDPGAMGSDFEALGCDIIPYDCHVTFNSYREADTCTLTIPLSAMPIEPRQLRAATIRVFAGTLDASVYADAVGPSGRTTVATVPDVDPLSGRSNEIFRGFVDGWEVELAEEQFIKIQARDTTQFLIDAKAPVTALHGIPASTPIDDVIRLVLLGEPLAAVTAQGAPLTSHTEGSLGERQDVRGATARLRTAVAAVDEKLVKAARRKKLAEVERLKAVRSTLVLRLAEAEAIAGVVDLPLVVTRFGIPGARGFRVVNRTGEDPLPTLGELRGLKWQDSKGHTKKARSAGSKEEISVWDLCTDICVGHGFIVYVDIPREAYLGTLPAAEIVISKPKTFYGSTVDVDGTLEADLNSVREFVYGGGGNCTMTIKRDLTGKNTPKAIEVKATTAETGRHLSLRFPRPVKTTKAAARAQGDREEVQTLLYGEVPEARAEEVLLRVAESLYEQLGRKEHTIVIKTTELAFLPSTLLVPGAQDILGLRAGDPVAIRIASGGPETFTVTSAGAISQEGIEGRAAVLRRIGFTEAAAARAVAAIARQRLQEVFRVRSVGVQWNHQSGFEIEIEAINYLDARSAIIEADVPGVVILEDP